LHYKFLTIQDALPIHDLIERVPGRTQIAELVARNSFTNYRIIEKQTIDAETEQTRIWGIIIGLFKVRLDIHIDIFADKPRDI
jgi:hypothetical protein